MKILVVGGGSGGHITPAVAVVREILSEKPRTRIEFWTDRKYYKNVVKITTEIGVGWGEESRLSGRRQYVQVRRIAAGKFHRYAGWEFSDYFRHFDITFKDLIVGNFVGLCGFIAGIVQSFCRLLPRRTRPEVIFLKGGFVGLPVGLVAHLLHIPYIVHESDAVPGLANRVLMRWASVIATGVPDDMGALVSPSSGRSSRPSSRGSSLSPRSDCGFHSDGDTKARSNIVWTGIPIAPEFKVVSATRQQQLKRAFGFDADRPLIIVTGGSQGSLHINQAVREILPEMLKFASVGLVAGRKHYEDMVDLKQYEDWEKAKLRSNFRMWNFNSAMDELLGAADVVISRAGATTIAELAALKKAVILVPYERLPGGHQVKNAERLVGMDAALMVEDERIMQQPGILLELARKLVRSPRQRADLAEHLHRLAKPDAAQQLAGLLLAVGAGDYVPQPESAINKGGKHDEED